MGALRSMTICIDLQHIGGYVHNLEVETVVLQDVTLHELMDEDDILQECKGQNHKLIEL